MKSLKRIGVLTGGGDSPGLNPAIRGVTLTAIRKYGLTVVGLRDGFNGLFDDAKGLITLDEDAVQDIQSLGGTILGTANQGSPFRMMIRDKRGRPVLGEDGRPQIIDRSAEAAKRLEELGIDGLVVIGGDGRNVAEATGMAVLASSLGNHDT